MNSANREIMSILLLILVSVKPAPLPLLLPTCKFWSPFYSPLVLVCALLRFMFNSIRQLCLTWFMYLLLIAMLVPSMCRIIVCMVHLLFASPVDRRLSVRN